MLEHGEKDCSVVVEISPVVSGPWQELVDTVLPHWSQLLFQDLPVCQPQMVYPFIIWFILRWRSMAFHIQLVLITLLKVKSFLTWEKQIFWTTLVVNIWGYRRSLFQNFSLAVDTGDLPSYHFVVFMWGRPVRKVSLYLVGSFLHSGGDMKMKYS